MSLSTPFIERPVATTTLLTIGIALAGIFAFEQLPVSPLPQVDFLDDLGNRFGARRQSRDDVPDCSQPGSNAILGVIANVTEMDVTEHGGRATRITLQFDLNRNIDGAARDVQAATTPPASTFPARRGPTQATARSTRPTRRSRSWR